MPAEEDTFKNILTKIKKSEDSIQVQNTVNYMLSLTSQIENR
jgi:hypothetical protein